MDSGKLQVLCVQAPSKSESGALVRLGQSEGRSAASAGQTCGHRTTSENDTLTQCWLNAGPASQTEGKRWLTSHSSWAGITNYLSLVWPSPTPLSALRGAAIISINQVARPSGGGFIKWRNGWYRARGLVGLFVQIASRAKRARLNILTK